MFYDSPICVPKFLMQLTLCPITKSMYVRDPLGFCIRYSNLLVSLFGLAISVDAAEWFPTLLKCAAPLFILSLRSASLNFVILLLLCVLSSLQMNESNVQFEMKERDPQVRVIPRAKILQNN